MATPGISVDGSNFLNSKVTVTMSFSPKTVGLYLTTLMSCVATVYAAKYSASFSLHVFVALANWANILLQRRLRSKLFFVTNNGTLPVDSLLEVAFNCPSKLKPLIISELSNGVFKPPSSLFSIMPPLMASLLLQLPCVVCAALVVNHGYLHLGLFLVILWSLYTYYMMLLTMLWRPNKSNISQAAANSKPFEEKSDESVDNKQEQDNIGNIAYIRREELKEETTEDGHNNKSEPNDKNLVVNENWCRVDEGEWEEVIRCSPQN